MLIPGETDEIGPSKPRKVDVLDVSSINVTL
jgi:hypothetical protein